MAIISAISTMISVWLWGGIFSFIYLYFKSRKEIKIAGLESVHLCAIFIIFAAVGVPIFLMDVFNFDKEEDENEELDYDEELVEKLEELKETIDLLLLSFKKYIYKRVAKCYPFIYIIIFFQRIDQLIIYLYLGYFFQYL